MPSRILGYTFPSCVLYRKEQNILWRVKARIVGGLDGEFCSISMFWDEPVSVDLCDCGLNVLPFDFRYGLRECHASTSN